MSARAGIAALLGLWLLAACAGEPQMARRAIPLPASPGIYALAAGDRLVRLDGPPDWEISTWNARADLDPDLLLVVDDPSLAAKRPGLDPPALELRQVAWIRSDINAEGAVVPVTQGNWVDTPLPALAVPLQTYWPAADRNVVVARPVRPLEPGLYTIHFAETALPAKARFGVAWSGVDELAYSSRKCVDRYVGPAIAYRPCSDQAVDIADAPLRKLRVGQIAPQRIVRNGMPVLVVTGTVTNTGEAAVQLPQLQASTMDRRGKVMGQWLFPADRAVLQPGEASRFRTEMPRPPDAISRVSVDLAIPESRWLRVMAQE